MPASSATRCRRPRHPQPYLASQEPDMLASDFEQKSLRKLGHENRLLALSRRVRFTSAV